VSTPSKTCIALVDADNYYFSCQATFQPSLIGKAVVVLSSNDGHIIARSRSAKMLGIPMGAPVFEYRRLIERAGGVCYSFNPELYTDMSRRIAEVLELFAGDHVEQYSIDEAFVNLSHVPVPARFATAQQIRATVKQWTGISVSIGVGASKVIAKLGSKLAKGDPDGVVDLSNPSLLDEVLSRTPVADLWEVGSRTAHALTQAGIRTGLQLKEADDAWVKRHLHVTGLRLVYELRGIQALPLTLVPAPSQSIMRARAFGRPVTEREELYEALAVFAARAAEKLRAEQRAARAMAVSLSTNGFRTSEPQYHNTSLVRLATPTNFTPDLVRHARAALDQIYRPGYANHRLGLLLTDFVHDAPLQLSWAETAEEREKQRRLMCVVDAINHRFGRDTLRLGTVGYTQGWRAKAGSLSPRFTTRWEEIVVAFAL
jgi:DNA polymerase V